MISINFGLFISILGLAVINCSKKTSDDEAIFSIHTSHSLPLEHSFGVDDKWAPRGTIIFRGSKVGGHAASSSEVELTHDEVDKLQRLVDENGLYFIRSPKKIGESFSHQKKENETNYVQTFVKACYLYGSKLNEIITVSVDYSGNVIGLNIVSPRSSCTSDFTTLDITTVYNSTVIVNQQVAGAVPDTQTFVKKLEQEVSDEKAGKGKDNRSFIAKYWMYILPVFLILVLSSQAEQPAEGGE